MVWLLVLVPATAALRYLLGAPPLAIFVAGGAAIMVLAEWMRRATEQLAASIGPMIGGLLNVSFGSAAELILALFVLLKGHADVVRAQITGSIIGTTLLGLGLAFLVGGASRDRLSFSRARAGNLSSLLLIVVFALLLPAVFDQADLARAAASPNRLDSEETLSIGVACVLLLLYGSNLLFTLVTHRDVFIEDEPRQRVLGWGLGKALAILAGATIAVAACAELVSASLQVAAATLHLPLLFVGVVPLALIGTAADLFAGVSFARQGRMNLVMSIFIGSAIQVGLVVAPLLILISWYVGSPMSLVFPSALNLFAITGAAFIVNGVTRDGETTWFEGLLLVGVYVLLAIAFYVIGPT